MNKQRKVVPLNEYRQGAETQTSKSKTKKKKKRRFRLNKRKFFRFLLLIILCSGGIYGIGSSPLFDLRSIEVEGNRTVSSEKVVSLSQIVLGENYFVISKDKVEKNLEQYPFIETATMKKKLPNCIVITIVERPAVGYIVTSNGYIQVSADGRMLAIQQRLDDYNLPVISGIELNDLPTLGGVIENDKFKQALKVISSCDEELLHNIAELNVSQEHYILAYTNQKIEVRLGDMDDIESRLNDLNDIIKNIVDSKIPEENIQYIDMRYQGYPYIKMKS